jgi:hypothetical protein
LLKVQHNARLFLRAQNLFPTEGPKGAKLFLGEEKPDLSAGLHSTLPTAGWHVLQILNVKVNVLKVRHIVPLSKLFVGSDFFVPVPYVSAWT